MFGRLVEALDDPETALGLVEALGEPSLQMRLAAVADAAGSPLAEVMAAAVRGFLDTASDDHWLQIVGVMNRADDPSLAAMRAILEKALPGAQEVGHARSPA
ncbi:MAG: hypothetical protein J0H41_15225 [Rhizobiales bacterium]|nr:hypothetical protein [Hyphomicrobiales bacterium]